MSLLIERCTTSVICAHVTMSNGFQKSTICVLHFANLSLVFCAKNIGYMLQHVNFNLRRNLTLSHTVNTNVNANNTEDNIYDAVIYTVFQKVTPKFKSL